MATFKRIEDIIAWQLARELFREVNLIVEETSLSRDFKLRDQVRSAIGAIMDNIAEGYGRGGNREFIHFLEIAHGSCDEVKSQLYRIFDSGYIDELKFELLLRLNARINKAIWSLISYLQKSSITGPRYTGRS